VRANRWFALVYTGKKTLRMEETMMPRAQIQDEKTYQAFPGTFGALVTASLPVAYG
jgi:hypothetical protein